MRRHVNKSNNSFNCKLSYSGTFLATVDITNKMASDDSQGIVFPCCTILLYIYRQKKPQLIIIKHRSLQISFNFNNKMKWFK